VQGSDGNLYGTTAYGGITGIYIYTNSGKGGSGIFTNVVFGYGTVFKVTTAGQLSLLYTFGTQQDENGNPLDGAVPNGLTQGPDGVLYGTTQYGGANDDEIGFYGAVYPGWGDGDGTLFSISPSIANSFATLISFDEVFPDGYNPIGSLAPVPGGTFLGVASAGGGDRKGAVFSFNPDGNGASNIVWLNKTLGDYSGNLQSFVDFVTFNLGGFILNPVPALLAPGTDGNFYGTTTDGGTNGDGTIYLLNLGSNFGAPVIQSAIVSNGSINITWSTTPGSSYQVQFSTSLTGGWSNLGLVMNASGTTLSTTDSIGGVQRFYRIVQIK
jgi:uncharacterized repeat protein (TIGR03803 family)